MSNESDSIEDGDIKNQSSSTRCRVSLLIIGILKEVRRYRFTF
ncbi:hypothetical protein [Rubritalea tangerina]